MTTDTLTVLLVVALWVASFMAGRRWERRRFVVRDARLDELRAWANAVGVPRRNAERGGLDREVLRMLRHWSVAANLPLRSDLDARDREVLYGVPGGSRPEGVMFARDGEEIKPVPEEPR